MKSWDQRVRRADRARLRAAVHRIFDRMVLLDDQFNNLINMLENRFRDLARLLVLVALGALFHLGFTLADLEFPGWNRGIEALESGSGRLILDAGLALIVYILFIGRLFDRHADAIVEACARAFVTARKLSTAKRKRAPLLAAVTSWMRTRPLHARTVFERLHGGKYVRDVFSADFVDKVCSVAAPGGPRFVVLRGLAERRPFGIYIRDWFRSPRAEGRRPRLRSRWLRRFARRRGFDYFLEARCIRNGLAVSLILDLLGAELRDEIPSSSRWRRQYVTNRDRQTTAVFDTGDLHDRFRTNSPHYRWPSVEREDSVGETAIYRVIQCAENPCRMPIYLIKARDVVARVEEVIADFYEECAGESEEARKARRERLETVMGKLVVTNVKMFGKYSQKSLQATSEAGIEPAPVLKDLALSKKEHEDLGRLLAGDEEHDWALRFDPNQIDWHDLATDQDTETTRAFAVLVEAIDRERACAQAVTLKRGDLMIVDNLRCLVARQEPAPRGFLRALFSMPQEWWLIGYYGFRESQEAHERPFTGHGERALLTEGPDLPDENTAAGLQSGMP